MSSARHLIHLPALLFSWACDYVCGQQETGSIFSDTWTSAVWIVHGLISMIYIYICDVRLCKRDTLYIIFGGGELDQCFEVKSFLK